MGNAIGDAYGLATEFMSARGAEKLYGNGPIAFGTDPGYPVWEDGHRSIEERNDFTDDTDQMLLLLQSLEQTKDGRLHPVNFAKKLSEWRRSGFPELGTPARGIGYTVGRVMRHPEFDTNPHKAAYDIWNSAGRDLAPNGAIMRTAVTGIESFWDEVRVVENTLAAAKVTHTDPRSVIGALVSAVLISRILRGGGCHGEEDRVRVWSSQLKNTDYRQSLLDYFERGTELKGNKSLHPEYEKETKDTEFKPKRIHDLNADRREREALTGEADYRKQFAGRLPSQWNQDRPEVKLREDIGWVGIDNVGEDDAIGSLARSVVADYIFLLRETNLVPSQKPGAPSFQEKWADELESHCFPRNMAQLDLEHIPAIGYAFKCIGVGVYGATRRIDPSPTAPEYQGAKGLFRGTMEQVTLQAGDADTNAAVMGSILGARFGLEQGIPTAWWTKLQHLNWMTETVDLFMDRVLRQYEDHIKSNPQ
ncbi:hypothetical protein BGW38_010899 [Lunasporangiospora selenospora]|uniref:ADP-ribosylglycohydrolase n=1 Tax=Lunasporangiospora selenospora TaxID=979761 RepID=A0A9P6FWF2_9FUNG|nr:hypothetical protein BGW38_010899 [Lunasporangiospora selenospora]